MSVLISRLLKPHLSQPSREKVAFETEGPNDRRHLFCRTYYYIYAYELRKYMHTNVREFGIQSHFNHK